MNFKNEVPDDTSHYSEKTFPNTRNSDSEEFRTVQLSLLTHSHISKNVNNYDVSSGSNVILNKTHIVEFDNNIACEIVQNEPANKSVELSAEIMIIGTNNCDKTNYMLKEKFYPTSFNLVDLSQATTSQDNSSFLSCTNEASILHTKQNKIKRSISKCQVQISSDTSIEKSDDSSDEILSKRQKLNESVFNTNEGNVNVNTVTFQRNTLIAEQRNYHLINESARNKSSNTNLGAGSETANNYQSKPCRHEDNWNKREASNEDKWDEQEEDEDEDENNKKIADYLKLREKFSNWHIVPEVINRQIGSNPLFERRFYSSLYAVERFQLMYKLYPCVSDNKIIDILNFNHKGNLLMCAGCDEISIWDWAVGKKSCSFTNNDNLTILHAKWLPLENFMAFSDEDGRIRLLDIESDMSTNLVMFGEKSYKLAVHPETPHIILSAGIDSRVLSIDIRESRLKELLVVKENVSSVALYSIDSNPSNSNEFCVAGLSDCVMAYDRRKVSNPIYKLQPYDDHDEYVFVTSAMYNYNGTEILASYKDKDLFLFNKLIMSSRGLYTHINQNVYRPSICDGIFFGPKSEYIVVGSNENICIWEKNSESVIQCITGDRESVICLEGHPHIPILATSVRDNNVNLLVSSKGELSVMRSFGNHFDADLLHYESNSNRDEDTNDDGSNSSSSRSDNFIEDNLSECGDVENIQCSSS
ncbi:DDB1- and CUL4-associated factor 8 [Trachymyrmex septentrionalis]|uniref:DDB1-and CUL4-associated factor 8 n=1 Tax=Trachymyrmex septentrionalis TaxID=34720 RepID=A0A151JSR2_9HYME|nr:PREDICTED: DDB1- and CUL4-associated factor 8-like [Trachymyrmex septentrionalis]KYN30612.1 DDB1- and CUL4-associated factor 8 [Trachymyrmex septentrionalis]